MHVLFFSFGGVLSELQFLFGPFVFGLFELFPFLFELFALSLDFLVFALFVEGEVFVVEGKRGDGEHEFCFNLFAMLHSKK